MLRIVEADLLVALSDNSPDTVSYLDRETGDVVPIQGDLFMPGDEEYVDDWMKLTIGTVLSGGG
jgi:hypothetical protein